MISSPVELSSNYPVYRCHVSEFRDLLDVEMPSANSILFVAADFDSIEGSEIVEIGKKLIAKGNAYFCVWGDGCEAAETNWEIASVESDSENEYGYHTMSTSHDDESMEEAAWFALNCAWVDEHLFESTSIILVSVKRDEIKEAIESICADPKAFNQREMEEEGVDNLINPDDPQINVTRENE